MARELSPDDPVSPYRALCATVQMRHWRIGIHAHPEGAADRIAWDTLLVTTNEDAKFSVHVDEDASLDAAAADLIAAMLQAGIKFG